MKSSVDIGLGDPCLESDSAYRKALRASEVRYRRLFESARDGILILDAETGIIIDVNPYLIELLKMPKEDFLEKEIWEIGFLRDIAANKEKFLELQRNEYVRYDNLPLETSEGKKISVEFVSNVYLEGERLVIQCNIRDITVRKMTEKALSVSENHLRTLVHTIPDLIWLKNEAGIYLTCNPMFERFFGAKEADIAGKSDYDFVNRELADFFREQDKKAMAAGKPTINEEWITFADDGRRVYLETIKVPLYDDLKVLIGVLGIGRDITKRKVAETELLISKEKAEESDRLKSAFLANMSHEIRTPMNGILGFTELLKEPGLTGSQQKEFLGIIEKSGERLLKIINDIIDISKIESGQMEINLSDTDVNEIMVSIYDFFRFDAAQKNISILINNTLQEDELMVRADKGKIYQVLINLAGNALKFTDSGTIEIGCCKVGSYIEFFVSDTGHGICKEQSELIFERFRQGSESLGRNYEGAGLGLAISKGFVEMMGGKIWVESKKCSSLLDPNDSDSGSTFFFTIPFKPLRNFS